ncbi:MAG: PKD domain-containing protein, partial [Bacteroidota bacterium]
TSLTVSQYTPNCDASFNYSPFSPVANLYAFAASNNDPLLSYQWDFGDGNNASGSSVIHQYAIPDTYLVCLIVTDTIQGSCSDTLCQLVDATFGGTPICDANFGFFPDSSGNPFSYNFFLFNQQTAGLNFSWDFGDGNTSTQAHPNHTFNAPGTYTVCLTVSDTSGCSDSVCQVINVSQGGTTCDASFLASPSPAGPFGFNGYDFIALDQSLQSYSWDFGDGNVGTGPITSHFYAGGGGTYLVTLVVTGWNGCTDSSFQTITIPANNPCDASFYTTILPNNQVDLQAAYPFQSNFFWDLGDGNTATGPNVTHTYASAGSYTVCLLVSDSIGSCVDTLCQTVNTSQIQPPPGFAVLGQVYAGNQVADDFTAWLVVYDSAAGTLTAVDTFVSDTNNYGFFFFTAPNGDYRVKASLNASSSEYANYMPTYYGDELFWNNATVVNQSSFPFIQINLIPGNNPGGPGFVGGLVSQGANKAEGDPLAGMHVVVTNDQGEAVIHTSTDEDGEYELANLAYGTYHIWIEMWGRSLEYHTITIAPGSESHTNVDFEVSSDAVTATGTTGIEDLLDPTSVTVFPNPLSGEQALNVQLSLKQSAEVNFSLQNMVGQVVINKTDRMAAGPQAQSLEVNTLPAGVYFLRMNIDGESMRPIKVVIQ